MFDLILLGVVAVVLVWTAVRLLDGGFGYDDAVFWGGVAMVSLAVLAASAWR
jgi:hypothetical protein